MPTEPDARMLLRVAPDQYVTERTRLVKQARAERDKDAAAFYQSLKRPNLSLWAVLAAADDADSVRAVVAATKELGTIQAGRGAADALATATKRRRDLLDALTDRAVAALAESDKSAPARRGEIRALVDQLSRQPDDTDAWIDGTLRDVGDASLGFAAFADMPVPEATGDRPTTTARPAKRAGTHKESPPAKATTSAPARQPAPDRTDPAKVREARRNLDIAARDLASAERRVQTARRAVEEAEASLRGAEQDAALAQRQHDRAAARLESARHG